MKVSGIVVCIYQKMCDCTNCKKIVWLVILIGPFWQWSYVHVWSSWWLRSFLRFYCHARIRVKFRRGMIHQFYPSFVSRLHQWLARCMGHKVLCSVRGNLMSESREWSTDTPVRFLLSKGMSCDLPRWKLSDCWYVWWPCWRRSVNQSLWQIDWLIVMYCINDDFASNNIEISWWNLTDLKMIKSDELLKDQSGSTDHDDLIDWMIDWL